MNSGLAKVVSFCCHILLGGGSQCLDVLQGATSHSAGVVTGLSTVGPEGGPIRGSS